ncbi:hypothetical protein [Lacrimispora sp.]|uniref:hypothetical protein n=1 Tax=Lacrimispora sp. TaxID=2719234 RepID=UPI0028A9EA2B|nr:hypothetical protein [Lacrimispora sp.]
MPFKENECYSTVLMCGSDGIKIPLHEIPILNFELVPDEEMEKAKADLQKPISLDFSMDLILPTENCLQFYVACAPWSRYSRITGGGFMACL